MVSLELSYDVLFTIGLLHEYMHKDNSIFIFDEDNDEFIYGEAYDYLSELSSITMELEFLDWLYKMVI